MTKIETEARAAIERGAKWLDMEWPGWADVMLEGLGIAEAADREQHRLRPLSDWTEADGEVIWYIDAEDEHPVVAILRDLDGERFWLPLPDRDKLWIRPDDQAPG